MENKNQYIKKPIDHMQIRKTTLSTVERPISKQNLNIVFIFQFFQNIDIYVFNYMIMRKSTIKI